MEMNIQNCSMTYPNGRQALRNISIALKGPSLVGLLGPNGAGKSTLMKLLVRAQLPTAGKITLDGTPLDRSEQALKRRLGYLPQAFGLFDELTVWQFLDYMAALKGLRDAGAAIRSALDVTDLQGKHRSPIRELSGGQRQRVGIAQALLGNPDLLILDEPTVGLDPEERVRMRNLFSRIAQEKLVLLSTHIIDDVQSVCNRLVVIDNGHLLFTGTPELLIAKAQGHVGTFREMDGGQELGLRITSRINTAKGVCFRAVADTLPPFTRPAEPTLEDAYLYLIAQEAGQ